MKEEPENRVFRELRSESVQEIIAYKPHWIVRWGTTLFSFFFVLLFVATFFVNYPDIIKSQLKITSIEIPKAIVAKSTGKLVRLFVKENSRVRKNQVLAYLEATGNHEEILKLAQQLNYIEKKASNGELDGLYSFQQLNSSNLGELQPDFQNFEQSFTQFQSFLVNGFYDKKKRILQKELEDLQFMSLKLKEQMAIYARDYSLAQKGFEAQQRLAKQGIVSTLELATEESKLIAKQLPVKQAETAFLNNKAEQSVKSKELLDLEKNLFEQKKYTLEALKTLISAINTWISKFIIMSPIDGQIFFQNTLQENQVIVSNQELFYIGAIDNTNNYLGEMHVAQDNFGKLTRGQKVIMRFNSYPSEEYGTVDGILEYISQIPDKENNYLIKVRLPSGLTTSYGKKLIFRNGMIATAEIIIEDKSLADKILYQFRRALQR